MNAKRILMRLLIIFSTLTFLVILTWFVIFKWSFVSYSPNDNYAPEICYSPNHEYYIKRYQTIAESIRDHGLNAEGIAIVYNKRGREIYRGKTDLSQMYGPYWSLNYVYMIGDYNWGTGLPSTSFKSKDNHDGCN